MKEVEYTKKDSPLRITVWTLEKGECKGWAGDRYISNGPSIVFIEQGHGEWRWEEYDMGSKVALEKIGRIIDAGFQREEMLAI